MEFDRRAILATLAGAAGMGGLPLASGAATAPPAAPGEDFAHPFQTDPNVHDDIAILLYPKLTAQDFIGPYTFLCFMGGAKIHLVTNQPDLSPVHTDTGMGIVPTTTMADCPRNLALILVPGGSTGTLEAARDKATLEFVRDRASRARYVSSVCTGSLILGAAGLLRGKRATAHWSVVSYLPQFGAIPVHKRVVEDGNLITAAGVSSGLDSGVLLVERLRGRPLAEAATLIAQYAPEPPFRGGNPETASVEIRNACTQSLLPFTDKVASLQLATDLGSL